MVVIGLGTVWILDGLELTIVSSIGTDGLLHLPRLGVLTTVLSVFLLGSDLTTWSLIAFVVV